MRVELRLFVVAISGLLSLLLLVLLLGVGSQMNLVSPTVSVEYFFCSKGCTLGSFAFPVY